jgi:hypothetical protein
LFVDKPQAAAWGLATFSLSAQETNSPSTISKPCAKL